MSDEFDPYLSWLGIRDRRRPPTHYRLLGLEAFESDAEVIANAADRQMAHVRTFQASKFSEFSQKLLNELAQAKICLLNPKKKGEYDALLRAETAAAIPPPPQAVPHAPVPAPPTAIRVARPVASVLPVDEPPGKQDEPSNPFLAPHINTESADSAAAGSKLPLIIVAAVVLMAAVGGGAWYALRETAPAPIAIETPPENPTPEPTKVEPKKAEPKKTESEPPFRLLLDEEPEAPVEEARPPVGQLRRFAGHKGRVTAIASNAEYALSAGADRLLREWTLESGRGKKFARVRDEVLTISLEGERALVGTAEGGLLIYDLRERRAAGQLVGHKGAVYAAAWLPGGERVVSAGRDGTVRLWDVAERREEVKLRTEGTPVTCLALSRDGLRVAAGTQDGHVLAWNLGDDNAQTQVYTPPEDDEPAPVIGVALSPDGALLVFALRGAPARIYQLLGETEGPTLDNEDGLTSLHFANANVVMATDGQGLVRLWNAADGERVARIATGESALLCASLAGDRGAMTGGLDGSIRLLELPIASRNTRPDPGVLHRLAGHKGEIRGVAISADGKKAVTVGADPQAHLWDVALGEELGTLGPHPGGAHSVAFFPSGDLVLTGGEDGQLRLWQTEARTLSKTLAGHTGPVTRICINADGDKAVTFDQEQNAQHWELPVGQKLASFAGVARGDRWDASFASQLAVSAGYDRRLRVWRLEDGKSPKQGNFKESWVTCVALSPTGTQAATAGEDGIVRIWQVDTASEVRRLEAHQGAVWSVAWSPDGKLLITGGQDKQVHVWDVASGRRVSRFEEQHLGPVTAVALASNNFYAVSGDKTGQAIVWALPPIESPDADPATFVKAGDLPTPPEKAVTTPLEADVRKQFKNEYARRTPAEKSAFAQLLYDAGKDEADLNLRYVLLNEARDQASAAGDIAKTFEAIDALERSFTLDGPQLRVDALTEAMRTVKSPEQIGSLLRQALAQADAAANGWRYDVALKFSALANTAAGKLNMPLVSAFTSYRDKNLRFLKNEYDRLKKPFDRLAEEPADGDANLQVGKLLCYTQGHWNDGLRMLALSSDPKLSRLADRELRRPVDAAALREIGRGWWDAANEETKPPYKLALQIRGYERTRDAKLAAEGDFLKVMDEQLTDMLKALAPKSLQFVSNLPEAEVLVGYGTFGKNGLLGYDSKGVRRIQVGGVVSPKGISMFPPEDGSSHVAYGTFGQFKTFQAKAAIADSAQQAEPDRALTFKVVGDGKDLWEGQVSRRGEAIDCNVNITGVDKLELIVTCRGANTGCQAVWLEPRLWPFVVD